MDKCFILAAFGFCVVLGQSNSDYDCSKPPALVDPHTCCHDGGQDEVTEFCAQKVGISDRQGPPSVESAACLADCILKEANLVSGESLRMENVRSRLEMKFPNDREFTDVMIQSFGKCGPAAQRKMDAIRKMPMADSILQRGCNPYSALVLGCTYMDYFQNCPASKWTSTKECEQIRMHMNRCSN